VGVMDLGEGGKGGYLLDNEEENKNRITDLNVTETTPRAVSYWLNLRRVLHSNLQVLPYSPDPRPTHLHINNNLTYSILSCS
jgi:hypothetical protein